MAPRNQPAQQQANQTRALTVPERQDQNLRTVVDLVTKKRDQLAMLLAGSSDPERFITVALAALQGTPKLLECTPLSIFAAIREAATYGLELGPLGDASLTPYGDEAQLSVEYRGYRKLAMRDGTVRAVAADVVYEADAFRIVSGSESPGIFHEPSLASDRGNVLGAYAWARLANGELLHVWMTEAQLYQRRNVSRAWQMALKYQRTDSIWHLWPIEMMRKTVVKRLCSEQLPLTPLVREALTRDTDADLARQEERSQIQPGQLQGGDARQRILASMGIAPAITAGDVQAAPIPDGDTQGGQPVIPDKDDQAAEAWETANGDSYGLILGAGAPIPTINGQPTDGRTIADVVAGRPAPEAASPPDPGQGASEAPAVVCSSASPYEDVPEPCSKPLGHRLVCGNGKATWETPKGWAGR